MEKSRGADRILRGRREERTHLEDPRIDGRVILKYIYQRWDGRIEWT
jgi:hypothetical protein